MLSQGTKWGDQCTIGRWAETYLMPQRNALTVHRLDRAASGLIIVAHSKKAAAALSALFADRRIEKQYYAVVHGVLKKNKSFTLLDDIDGKQAVSHVKCIETSSAYHQSIVEISIETGRKHQIRRHLSAHGNPILGDRLYGTPNDDCDLKLVSGVLKFICPISGRNRHYLLPVEKHPVI